MSIQLDLFCETTSFHTQQQQQTPQASSFLQALHLSSTTSTRHTQSTPSIQVSLFHYSLFHPELSCVCFEYATSLLSAPIQNRRLNHSTLTQPSPHNLHTLPSITPITHPLTPHLCARLTHAAFLYTPLHPSTTHSILHTLHSILNHPLQSLTHPASRLHDVRLWRFRRLWRY